MQLESAAPPPTSPAPQDLGGQLGDIKVEERDDGVYAQWTIGPRAARRSRAPMLLGTGCGGGFCSQKRLRIR